MSTPSGHFVLPVRELRSSRVKLVPFDPSLHADPFIVQGGGSPDAWAHQTLGPYPTASDFTERFIGQWIAPNPASFTYAVIDLTKPPRDGDEDGALAGIMSYTNASAANSQIEIGTVVMLPAFRGTHVASNGIGLMCEYILDPPEEGGLGMRRVVWQTNSVNEASTRTAQRLGFKFEGVLMWDRVFADGVSRGKIGNGRPLRRGQERDLGRDTARFGLTWDVWEGGGREVMLEQMKRRA